MFKRGCSVTSALLAYDTSGNALTILSPGSSAPGQCGTAVKSFEALSPGSVTGTFRLHVSPSVRDFRVEATGGARGGEPFTGTMMAEVRGYDPATGIVYIHPATTLVAACMRKHSDWSLQVAEAAVRRFLDVPDTVDIGAGLRGENNPYFHHATFLAEAAANGGLDQFVATLTDEMDASSDATHTFVASASGGGSCS